MKEKIKRLSSLLIIFLLSGLLISPGSAEGYFSIKMRPKDPGDEILTYKIQPGETIKDIFGVKNVTTHPIQVKLYGVDGRSTKGKFALSTIDIPQRTIGKWIIFDTPEVILQPGQEVEIPFVLTVPKNTPPGTYPGGITAQNTPSKSLNSEALAPQSTGMGGVSVIRIGYRMMVVVPGEIITSFSIDDLTHQESRVAHEFISALHNEGNTIIRANSKIEISGTNLEKNVILEQKNISILPQETSAVKSRWTKETIFDLFQKETTFRNLFELKKPIYGKFHAKMEATYETYDLASNKYSAPKLITKEVDFVVIPWNLIIIISGLLLLVISWIMAKIFLTIRFRKKCRPYIIQPGDTLINVAQRFNIKWKKLARLNKIKAPYILSPGWQILVPQPKTNRFAPPKTGQLPIYRAGLSPRQTIRPRQSAPYGRPAQLAGQPTRVTPAPKPVQPGQPAQGTIPLTRPIPPAQKPLQAPRANLPTNPLQPPKKPTQPSPPGRPTSPQPPANPPANGENPPQQS